MAAPQPQQDAKQLLTEAADAVSVDLNADILLVNAQIYRPLDTTLMRLCRARRRKPNLVLILVTGGGDPDVAYGTVSVWSAAVTRAILVYAQAVEQELTATKVGRPQHDGVPSGSATNTPNSGALQAD